MYGGTMAPQGLFDDDPIGNASLGGVQPLNMADIAAIAAGARGTPNPLVPGGETALPLSLVGENAGLFAAPAPMPMGNRFVVPATATSQEASLDRVAQEVARLAQLAQAPAPNSPALSQKQQLAMMIALPFVMKKGGPGGVAALLNGIQQRRDRDEQEAVLRQQQDFVRQGRVVDLVRLQQEQLDRQERQRQDRLVKQQGWLEDVRAHLDTTTSGSDFDRVIADARAMAPAFGLEGAEIDKLMSRREAVLQKSRFKTIQDTLDRAVKNPMYAQYVGTPQFDAMVLQLPGEPDGISIGDAKRLVGGYVLDNGRPVSRKTSGLTYGDVFPHAKGTRMETQPVPMKSDGTADLNDATLTAQRMGWIARDNPQSASDARQARKDAIETIRDKVKLAVRSKNLPRTLARQMTALGLDVKVEVDLAARAIEHESVERARAQDQAGPTADVTSAEELIAEAERDLAADESPTAPRPPAVHAAPAPTQKRRATPQDVAAVAKAQGVSVAEATRQLKARGIEVVP